MNIPRVFHAGRVLQIGDVGGKGRPGVLSATLIRTRSLAERESERRDVHLGLIENVLFLTVAFVLHGQGQKS